MTTSKPSFSTLHPLPIHSYTDITNHLGHCKRDSFFYYKNETFLYLNIRYKAEFALSAFVITGLLFVRGKIQLKTNPRFTQSGEIMTMITVSFFRMQPKIRRYFMIFHRKKAVSVTCERINVVGQHRRRR